jgi:hypothetical protein
VSAARDRFRASLWLRRRRAGLVAAVALLVCHLAFVELQPGIADAAESPIGAHSMLQLNSPYSFMQLMFADAAAMNASAIRLDVAPAIVFGARSQPPDFSGLDEVIGLSEQYHVRVVADLFTIPSWIAACQTPTDVSQMVRCGTDDLADYRSMIAQIVARADPVIRDWEIWNEPDNGGFFTGTPAQYAQMLRTADDAIKAIDPQAEVLLGGISGRSGMRWLAQVFAVPGADAAHAFDIANIHERGWLAALAADVASWKQFLGLYGFAGPLWVTEHGYPSDPGFQYDPGYADGPDSQAAYLTASIPTLIDAGAAEVLITERDNLGGQFASEGVLGGDVLDPPVADPQVVEKPAYAAVRAIADCYTALGRNCAGPPPLAVPASLTIPATALGSSAVSTVAVHDPGPGPLLLGNVALVGGAGPIALRSNTCSTQILEPDQICTIDLRFTPVVRGPVTAELLLPSDNGTLGVAVSAVAPPVPAITLLTATGRTRCFARASRNRVLVLTTQRSSLRWQLRRGNMPNPPCRGRLAPGGPLSGPGRSSANGAVATGARPIRSHGGARFLARFALPVRAGRRSLRPGAYQLIVTASNANGASPPTAMWLTVLR